MPEDNFPPPPPSDPSPSADAPPPPPPPFGSPTSDAVAGSATYGAGKLSASDDKTFCVLAHVLGIVAGFIAPLVIWLVKKDESPAVEAHGKEALNFQITLGIAYLATFVLSIVSCGFLGFLPLLVWLYGAVMSIIATMKASDGQFYRYPATIRLVK